MTFVVIGAGFVGVELMGELTEFLANVAAVYPTLSRRDLRFELMEALGRIAPEFDDELADYAADVLAKRGESARAASLIAEAERIALLTARPLVVSRWILYVPLKALTYGKVEPAAGSTVRQEVTLQQGIPIEKARDIVKTIKNSKLKVQASIQADTVRVSGRDRDTLQQVIQLLKKTDFGIDMQFTNYRTL